MGAFIDETGNTHGRLTVIRRNGTAHGGGARWLCRCSCGKMITVSGGSLRSGNTKSCGCGRAKDEVGNTYGSLRVIERAECDHPYVAWLCQCSCGNKIVVLGCNLRSGNTKSCGCKAADLIRQANRLAPGEAVFNILFAQMKYGAKRRGLSWHLSKEQVRKLTKENCHYCGAIPSNVIQKERYFGAYTYNGLDRVDNGQGYTLSNVVPCCIKCNRAKHAMSIKDFAAWVKSLYSHWARQR